MYCTFWARAIAEIKLDPEVYTPHTSRYSRAIWCYSQAKDVTLLNVEDGWESDEWKRYVQLVDPTLGVMAARFDFAFTDENEQKSNFAEMSCNTAYVRVSSRNGVSISSSQNFR
jgi:hypothetical protein